MAEETEVVSAAVQTISDIVSTLIATYKAGHPIDVRAIITKCCKRFG